VGINLTQANRIFLMEPSFNPALEAQAIGRCHRLGQKRPVETIRLIVKGSFEERMTNFIEKKYGLSSKKGEEDSNEENKDKKKSMDMDNSKVRDLAGNLQTDKCTLMLEEFDALFGAKDLVLPIENSSGATKPKAGSGVKADKIISGIV
jgi:superfamily II DNA or RNA helicase